MGFWRNGTTDRQGRPRFVFPLIYSPLGYSTCSVVELGLNLVSFAAARQNVPGESDEPNRIWVEPSQDSDSEYEPDADDEDDDHDMSGEFGVFDYDQEAFLA